MIKSQYDNSILVVENESVIAFTLEETLINIGYKNINIALTASSAQEMMENNNYDLVILDINLGNKYDGIELATIIKEKQSSLPIVFLTGYFDNLTVSKAKEVEPNAFIVKPFNENEIKINLDIIFFQRTKDSRYTQQNNELKFSRIFLNSHPNFIIRIDKSGGILFVNYLINRITGKTPADYKNKTIYNSDFEEELITIFKQCIENTEIKKRKFSLESNIPTVFGVRMMFIVVIPEFKIESELSSIVLLMQDITDQKIASNDLTIRNKKITDSITYSKKIQEAILPTSIKLQHYLPDSCILLKPKDMVSGDFPWVYKKDEYIYIAAVDCTGHGVPGALLSLIIHFLLNEIVKTSGALLPGKILEILHIYTKKI